MKGFKLFVVLFFALVITSCGQQKKYISYTVKEGETMKEIAKRLDMKTKDLLRLNPDVSRRPNANTVIIIPNKSIQEIEGKITPLDIDRDSIKTNPLEPVELGIRDLRRNYVLHKVRKGDTFYRLTRFFNVRESDIRELNPQLSERGLEVGEYIAIKPIEEDDDNIFYEDIIQDNVKINIAMLLPFRAAEYDTIPAENIFSRNNLPDIVTDFYMGSQIAIDSIRKLGIDVNLKTYDTGSRGSRIREILDNEELDKNDVLIGPFYSGEAKIVANRIKTPIVYPVYSRNQSDFQSRRIVKAIPNYTRRKEILVKYIKEKYTNQNIIIVSDSAQVQSPTLAKTIRTLKSHDSINEVKIVQPKNNYIQKETLLNSLVSGVENIVILETEDTVLYSDVVNSLISIPTQEDIDLDKENGIENNFIPLSEDTSIRIVAYRKGKEFDIIDNNKLAKLNFTFVTDNYENEDSEEVKIFNKKYLEKNHTTPSYYATKGFDITYDVLIRLASGDELKDTFKEGISLRVETKFDYSKQIFSTTDNRGLFIIQYNPDLTLTRLK